MPRVASIKAPTNKQAGPASAAPVQQRASFDSEVARVAYELYEKRGRADGFDKEDWIEAESIVRQHRGRRAQ